MKLKKTIFLTLIVAVAIVLIAIFWTKKSAKNYFERAQSEQNLEKKIKLLTKVISFDKDFKQAYLLRADTYLKLASPDYGDIFGIICCGKKLSYLQERYVQKAAIDLEKIEQGEKDLEMGQVHFFMQNYSKAFVMLNRALKKTPKYFDAILFTGFAHMTLKDYNATIKLFEKALDLGSDKIEIRLMIARLHEMKGEIDSAMEHYRYVIDLGLDDPDELYSLSGIFILRKDFNYAQKAINTLNEAPDNKSTAQILYAAYYWNKDGDKKKTFSYLEEAKNIGGREFDIPETFPVWLFKGLENNAEFKNYLP
ncbi:MAG TPA: hypothetical protein VMW66_03125 [Elusimicrobiales bacterium]|nr:hypothetical protein [Elusimicrobiales bacterium]